MFSPLLPPRGSFQKKAAHHAWLAWPSMCQAAAWRPCLVATSCVARPFLPRSLACAVIAFRASLTCRSGLNAAVQQRCCGKCVFLAVGSEKGREFITLAVGLRNREPDPKTTQGQSSSGASEGEERLSTATAASVAVCVSL